MVIPIFVVGNNRAGTKWLSNLLINHPEISGIVSHYHRGILETNIFNHFLRVFGDLGNIENYIGFVECFAATDFFRITGMDKNILYRIKCDDYFEFFRRLMDLYAVDQNTKFWLQKIHSLNFQKVRESFKDAIFIFISRSVIDNIRSAYVIQKRFGQSPSIFRELIIYVYSQKILNKYRNKKSVFSITFEALKKNTGKVVEEICEFLGVEYSSDMIRVVFKKNTSFGNEEGKNFFFPKRYVFIVRIFSKMFGILPKFFFDALFKLRSFLFQNRRYFAAGTFSKICDEQDFKKIEY